MCWLTKITNCYICATWSDGRDWWIWHLLHEVVLWVNICSIGLLKFQMNKMNDFWSSSEGNGCIMMNWAFVLSVSFKRPSFTRMKWRFRRINWGNFQMEIEANKNLFSWIELTKNKNSLVWPSTETIHLFHLLCLVNLQLKEMNMLCFTNWTNFLFRISSSSWSSWKEFNLDKSFKLNKMKQTVFVPCCPM